MRTYLLGGVIVLVVALGGAVPPAAAQSEDDTATEPDPQTTTTRSAKQERQDDYLLRKAEKSARKAEQQAAGSGELRGWKRHRAERSAGYRPESTSASAAAYGLDRWQARLRQTPLVNDPEALAYLDHIDTGRATPSQIAAFGNLLSDRGYDPVAVEYYRAALREDPTHRDILMNLGVVQLQLDDLSGAKSSFEKILKRDPADALAHYNLGAAHQRSGDYEKAIDSYRRALVIDPSLGEPETNPQAVVNDILVPVKLLIYDQQIGRAGSPRVPIADGEIEFEGTPPQ